jgi:hypothetical protein
MTDSSVHLLYNSSWKFYQLAARQLMLGQLVWYGKGRRHGPSITCKITSAGSLSSSQPGGPPCWDSPLAFDLIGLTSDHNTKLTKYAVLVTITMLLYINQYGGCTVMHVSRRGGGGRNLIENHLEQRCLFLRSVLNACLCYLMGR